MKKTFSLYIEVGFR